MGGQGGSVHLVDGDVGSEILVEAGHHVPRGVVVVIVVSQREDLGEMSGATMKIVKAYKCISHILTLLTWACTPSLTARCVKSVSPEKTAATAAVPSGSASVPKIWLAWQSTPAEGRAVVVLVVVGGPKARRGDERYGGNGGPKRDGVH